MTSEKTCRYCAETIKNEAIKCRYCGEFVNFSAMAESAGKIPIRLSAYNPGLAAAMSTVLPGLGQIFQGRLGIGLLILIAIAAFNTVAFLLYNRGSDTIVIAVFFWIAALVVYIENIYHAYRYRPSVVDQTQWEKAS